MYKDYRDETKKSWGTKNEWSLSIEQINCGALLRIADAAEMMAKNHAELIAQRDYFKARYEDGVNTAKNLRARNAALRGQITKLKRKAQQVVAVDAEIKNEE